MFGSLCREIDAGLKFFSLVLSLADFPFFVINRDLQFLQKFSNLVHKINIVENKLL